jgi:hypothetical protein
MSEEEQGQDMEAAIEHSGTILGLGTDFARPLRSRSRSQRRRSLLRARSVFQNLKIRAPRAALAAGPVLPVCSCLPKLRSLCLLTPYAGRTHRQLGIFHGEFSDFAADGRLPDPLMYSSH